MLTIDSILDVLNMIYVESKKKPLEQKSFRQISEDCHVSYQHLTKIRTELKNRNILFETGRNAGMTFKWNPDKTVPNKDLAESIATMKCIAPKPKTVSLKDIDDEQLVKELRNRGWDVVCTKSI